MLELTKRQQEIISSLICKELLYLELDVQGALEILSNDNYHTELVKLRAAIEG